MNLAELADSLWKERLLFWRPDPLGYCIIIKKMIETQKYFAMSLEDRQRMKGYSK